MTKRTILTVAVLTFGIFPVTAAAQESANWAGYVDTVATSVTVHGVSANMTLPTVNVRKTTSGRYGNQASFWVGVGGYVRVPPSRARQPLVQVGVAEKVDSHRHAQYYAWWELAPWGYETRMQLRPDPDFRGPTLRPGDDIEMAISKDGGTSYIGYVEDVETGAYGAHSFALRGPLARYVPHSGEVIAERPNADDKHARTLTDFGALVVHSADMSVDRTGDNGGPVFTETGPLIERSEIVSVHQLQLVAQRLLRRTLAVTTPLVARFGSFKVTWIRGS